MTCPDADSVSCPDDSGQDALADARTLALDAIDDEEAFNAALQSLLQAARENGVDLERVWSCRNGHDGPDWDVTVVRVVSPNEG